MEVRTVNRPYAAQRQSQLMRINVKAGSVQRLGKSRKGAATASSHNSWDTHPTRTLFAEARILDKNRIMGYNGIIFQKERGEMVSTVTTTTVSTVTTVALAASLGLVAIVTLLALLIQKELVTAATGPRAKALGRVLNTAIVPLLMAFAFIVAVKVAEVLR